MPGAGGGGRSPTAPFAPLLPTVLRLHLMPASANGRLALQGKQLGMEARMQQAPFIFALWLLRCMRYEACSIAIIRHCNYKAYCTGVVTKRLSTYYQPSLLSVLTLATQCTL